MKMKEVLTSEYRERLDKLDVTIKEKEAKIQDIEKNLIDLSKRSKEKTLVSIEPVFEGKMVSIYKKGNVVRVFPKESESEEFKDSLLALSKNDFIVNGIISSQEDKSILYLTDCFYSNQDLSEMSFANRKKALDSFAYSDCVKQNGCLLVESQEDANKAMELIEKTSGVYGLLIKTYSKQGKSAILYNK